MDTSLRSVSHEEVRDLGPEVSRVIGQEVSAERWIDIPDEILHKRGPLTLGERKIVEEHPTRGYELLSHIPFLEKAMEIPYCHHEHWDGSGYPRGLSGEEIPLGARIFSVIDVWDAVQSQRPYNHAWTREQATQYLKDESGKLFDPACVTAFLDLVEQGKI